MLNQTLEAIELDKYDEHIEFLNNLMSMSEEEKAAFEKKEGIELDIDLFKKYVPEIIKTAEKTRSKYLKHLNKHDSAIAAAMTHNDMQVERFNEQIKRNDSEIASVRKGINGYNSLSNKAKTVAQSEMKIKALKRANQMHEKIIDQISSETDKKNIEEVIISNAVEIRLLETEINDAKEQTLSDREKQNDKLYGDALDQGIEEMYDLELDNVMLQNASQLRAMQNKLMGTDKFKREQRLNRAKKKAEGFEKSEDVDKAKAQLDKDKTFNAEEKKELTKALDKRRAVLLAKEKAEREEADKAKHEAEAKRKAEEEAAKNAARVNNNNQAPIGDGIEDVNADEEPDFNESLSSNQDDKVNDTAKSEKSIALLDQVGDTEGFQEWKQNGKPKVGQKVTYEASFDYGGDNQDIHDAIELFQTLALEDWNEEVAQQIYNYLPIRAVINDSVFTYLPTKNPSYFEENYLQERTNIINQLAQGKTPETEIQFTSGGGIVQDYDSENETVPEYSVGDLQQVKDISDVEFMATNKDGVLMDMNKDPHPDFAGYVMTLNNDTEGRPMPYRGGLFMVVKKADGTLFPMKLNFLKNTDEQADVLVDMLIRSTVTKKGQKAEIPFSAALSTIDPELAQRIKDVMGPELEVLGEDPKFEDIINMFVYVNEETKGLSSELYRKGGALHFGEGKKINAKNSEDKAIREALFDFLRNKKRRQFSIRLYNEFPKYKQFVIDNKVVNHNGTISSPLFQTTDERRIQTYVKPIVPDEKPGDVIIENNDIAFPPEVQARVDKTNKIGYTEDHEGFKGMYYFYKGGQRNMFYPGTEEEARAKVMKRYEDEVAKASIPHTKPVINDTPTPKKNTEPQENLVQKKPVKKKADTSRTEAMIEKKYREFDSQDMSLSEMKEKLAELNQAAAGRQKDTPGQRATRSALRRLIDDTENKPKKKTPVKKKVVSSQKPNKVNKPNVKDNPNKIVKSNKPKKVSTNVFGQPKKVVKSGNKGKINKDCTKKLK